MSDSSPKLLAPVTEDNQQALARRQFNHTMRKARDRRVNFEKGELSGAVYVLALVSIACAAGGYFGSEMMPWWARTSLGLLGIVFLGIKSYIKRSFWEETEDAEYTENDDGTT